MDRGFGWKPFALNQLGYPSRHGRLKPTSEARGQIFPHVQMLLRWTTAFSAKFEKYKIYLAKGTVRLNDGFVIAINGCQLALTPTAHGTTPFPFGVEAAFPVGPLQYRFNRETRKFEGASIGECLYILNHKLAEVATTSFLNPAYAGISAVIGCAADRRHGSPLPVHVAHNPLPAIPAPTGIWGADGDEWFATPVSEFPGEYERSRRQAVR